MLAWLQESSFGVWVAESIWAYPLVLSAHTIGLALLVGGATLFNLRALGVGAHVSLAPLRTLLPVMMAGLVVNAATGLTLFVAAAQDRGVQWVFYAKLACIAAALVVDGRVRSTLAAEELALTPAVSARTRATASSGGGGRLALAEGAPLTDASASAGARGLALTSMALWTGAIVFGRLIAYL